MGLILPNNDDSVGEFNPHSWFVELQDGEVNLRIVSNNPKTAGRIVNLRYNGFQATQLGITLLQGGAAVEDVRYD